MNVKYVIIIVISREVWPSSF